MLTSDTLKVRWSSVTEVAGGYSRIDPVHPLELYIGYEGLGQRSLLLISRTEPHQVPSSKSVVVQVGQRADGKWSTSFRLVRREQEEVFLQLCCDLIESSRQPCGDQGVESLLDRYRRWHKLMERQADGLLSESARKGLIGELLFLQHLLARGKNPADAVGGWMGPERGDRDFVFQDGWYEIKTVGASATNVTISSLEQLDAPAPGALVICFVDKTSSGDPAGFTLNCKVNELRAMMQDTPTVLETFDTKLAVDFGYMPMREYDSPSYRTNGMQRYTVDSRFPRLTKANVPVQVAGATYEISLSALSEWRSE